MEKDSVYLVTGAAGHLGTTITEKLLRVGKKVRALCLAGEKYPPQGAEIVYGNVCDAKSLGSFFEGTENQNVVVIHCAGIVSISSKFDKRVYDVNVGGTKNIVDLCFEYKVGKLIYVSSVHAIEEKAAGETIVETTDFSPDKVVGLYAKTKSEATAYVFDAARRGLDAEVVFPSGIIGPNDRGHSHTNTLISDYINGKLTAAVRGGYDFVDVRDVADGIISCSENGKPGEGYILSGKYHTIREILHILHEQTGQREIKTFLPVWFVNLTAPLCEMYYKLRREPPLFTKYSIYTLSTNSSFSNEKARLSLGFSPRSISDTLRDTVAWLRSNGKLQTEI